MKYPHEGWIRILHVVRLLLKPFCVLYATKQDCMGQHTVASNLHDVVIIPDKSSVNTAQLSPLLAVCSKLTKIWTN